MVTAAEDLVGWLQGPRYDSSMAALVHSLASPSTGEASVSQSTVHIHLTWASAISHMLAHESMLSWLFCHGGLLTRGLALPLPTPPPPPPTSTPLFLQHTPVLQGCCPTFTRTASLLGAHIVICLKT